ncbi:hypothetical protein TOK_0925 [Pseudonocardia sp. N23]|nr:hypothetical protein TOK_0925 [Pseudonocardia sp. N23]
MEVRRRRAPEGSATATPTATGYLDKDGRQLTLSLTTYAMHPELPPR